MEKKDKIKSYFSEEKYTLPKPLVLRDGTTLSDPVLARRSRFYPGHVALIAQQRALRSLPIDFNIVNEDIIDKDTCKFCHPDQLCAESEQERTTLNINGHEYIMAYTPYYYLPGHAILFPARGPHRLEEAGQIDWFNLLQAGNQAISEKLGTRLGFNAGTYLCSGGSQRHLHIQLVPMAPMSVPAEESLRASIPNGVSFDQMHTLFNKKGLILERASNDSAFLTACWAPKFSLELLAVFREPGTFQEMGTEDINILSKWINGVTHRFIVPQGGGINGYGMEMKEFPFMVRIIPRLPGAVQAFMETGAGCMVIGYLPEAIPDMWNQAKSNRREP